LTEAIGEKLFARKSSGLMKEASSLQATIWNIANLFGSKFGWSVAYLGLWPAGLILGYSPFLWGVLLFGAANYLLAILYVQITTPMPRSGADYVIPARLMGPFWGWINSWMIVWSWVPIWGFAGWLTLRNIKQLVDILRVSGVTTASAGWLLQATPAAALIASLTVIIGVLMCATPPRRYYSLIAGMGILAIIGLVIIAFGTAIVSQSALAANMKALTGVTPQELISTAISKGYDPNGTNDFTTAAGMMGFILFGIGGYQYSASISGELRGDVKKGLTRSILGCLTIYMITTLIFVWFILVQFGYDFTVGWSYLFWNAGSAAPLGLPPINALITTLAAPNLWPLWFIAAIVAIVGTWLCVPASMLYINRLVLAWGIDRMIPKGFSEVHPRLRQPMRIVLVEAILGVLFALTTIYLDFNPIYYAYWSVIMTFASFVFPSICALLLVRRRPDLAKAVPWRRWLIPVAVLWLIIIIPFYIFAGIIGSVPPLTPGLSFVDYAMSTGLIATAVTILIGIVLYFIIRWYNKRRGIDFKQIFQTIPPE
jgi:APA family basic amino acid/polyamine antiporter